MTYETACRQIKELFETEWGNTTTVLYPNEIEDIGNPDFFARLNILPGSGRVICVGGKNHQRVGSVIVQLFAKAGTGQDDLGFLEEKATLIFLQNNIDGIRFYNVGANRIGNDGNGYYQSNVNINFTFETKV